ncbi:uncharacterized protein L969DRAFT_92401 [Mixia osmundae IAM 14324]|uniref:Uncharacterized protein n=1 Tax=Mixia osmundae (strain CBS 9802 / IAM 14324 / JCM 22182 / KY 12970) TaxID=764103 RepID=G7DXM8_MIXOS|nr:uncharacterized protein L969DRAFT_92401 [Mixia osmundae IAM 14324]KEI41168.1 hypothetical protein L969DRAFT_92401 [Mixia osmundae IAM 14324]GAA95338.1 hypothetical protein E5Q_01995 [Mixia osmundae IAM 14324]
MRSFAMLALAFVAIVHAAVIGGDPADGNVVAKRAGQPSIFIVDIIAGDENFFECVFDVAVDLSLPLSQRYKPQNFVQGCQLGRISTNELLGRVSVLIEVLSSDKLTTLDVSIAADIKTGNWQAWLLSTASHIGNTYLGDTTDASLAIDGVNSGRLVPRCFYQTKLNKPGGSYCYMEYGYRKVPS